MSVLVSVFSSAVQVSFGPLDRCRPGRDPGSLCVQGINDKRVLQIHPVNAANWALHHELSDLLL